MCQKQSDNTHFKATYNFASWPKIHTHTNKQRIYSICEKGRSGEEKFTKTQGHLSLIFKFQANFSSAISFGIPFCSLLQVALELQTMVWSYDSTEKRETYDLSSEVLLAHLPCSHIIAIWGAWQPAVFTMVSAFCNYIMICDLPSWLLTSKFNRGSQIRSITTVKYIF